MQSLRAYGEATGPHRSHCEPTAKQPRVKRSVTRTTDQFYINLNKNIDVIYRFFQIDTGYASLCPGLLRRSLAMTASGMIYATSPPRNNYGGDTGSY